MGKKGLVFHVDVVKSGCNTELCAVRILYKWRAKWNYNEKLTVKRVALKTCPHCKTPLEYEVFYDIGD